jgi:hypothetical protein
VHFVEMTPLVGQPVLSCMHLHSSEALFDVHAAGTALQLDGFHADVDESYVSAQYWLVLHVAEPHVAPVGVGVGVGCVVLLPGHRLAKLVEFEIASQLLFSRHVSWSAVGLALQT